MIAVISNGVVFATHSDLQQAEILVHPMYDGMTFLKFRPKRDIKVELGHPLPDGLDPDVISSSES